MRLIKMEDLPKETHTDIEDFHEERYRQKRHVSLQRIGCQGCRCQDVDAITAVSWHLHPSAEYSIYSMTLWIRPSCGLVWHNLRVVSRILDRLSLTYEVRRRCTVSGHRQGLVAILVSLLDCNYGIVREVLLSARI